MSTESFKKLPTEWTPVEGRKGMFVKAATRSAVTDPGIQRALDELREKVKQIEAAAEGRASGRFSFRKR